MSRGCSYCDRQGCNRETCPERLEDRYGDAPYVGLSEAQEARVARTGPHHCDVCDRDCSTLEELREHDCTLADGGTPTSGIERFQTWYDVEWIDCIRCRGTGQRVECMDDLCHAQGRCMHGNNRCNLCDGTGEITRELAERWREREAFESVEAPDADLWRRGKLHAVARERHQDDDPELRADGGRPQDGVERSNVVESGVTDGYQWEVRLVNGSHFCGYVRTNFRPPWSYDDFQGYPAKVINDVHGGLTYGPDEDGWLGFDCAHAGDVCLLDGEEINDYAMSSRREWTPEDVAEECESLAHQVAAVEEFAERFAEVEWGESTDE